MITDPPLDAAQRKSLSALESPVRRKFLVLRCPPLHDDPIEWVRHNPTRGKKLSRALRHNPIRRHMSFDHS